MPAFSRSPHPNLNAPQAYGVSSYPTIKYFSGRHDEPMGNYTSGKKSAKHFEFFVRDSHLSAYPTALSCMSKCVNDNDCPKGFETRGYVEGEWNCRCSCKPARKA